MTLGIIESLQLPPALLGQARSLEHLGLSEHAWPREAATSIVRALHARQIAVLGGDVLTSFPSGLKHSSEGWHSDPRPNEHFADYAARSQDETLSYLDSLPSHRLRSLVRPGLSD